jgi:hypothetical protein
MDTTRLLATYNIWLRLAAGFGMPITKVIANSATITPARKISEC